MPKKSLVDALHIELLRYKYDDRQEYFLTTEQNQELQDTMATLVRCAHLSNEEIIVQMRSQLKKIKSKKIKARLNSILDKPTCYGNHRDIKFERKSHANIHESYSSDYSYILDIWAKPEGHVTVGSIGAKRIRISNSNLSKEQNPNKYLNRWLIKQAESNIYNGRVEEIVAADVIRKSSSSNIGKERAFAYYAIVSKLFPNFCIYNEFVNTWSSGDINNLTHNINQHSPVHIINYEPHIFGKPIIGLVEVLALAYVFESFDIGTFRNFGFSDYPEYIKFELFDFGLYRKLNQSRLNSLEEKLNEGKITDIKSFLIPERLRNAVPLTDPSSLNILLTKSMIKRELPIVINNIKNKTKNPLIIQPKPQLTDAAAFWDFQKIMEIIPDDLEYFEHYCITTIEELAAFPLEQAYFILMLQKHPSLNFENSSKRSVLGELIDEIIENDVVHSRNYFIKNLRFNKTLEDSINPQATIVTMEHLYKALVQKLTSEKCNLAAIESKCIQIILKFENGSTQQSQFLQLLQKNEWLNNPTYKRTVFGHLIDRIIKEKDQDIRKEYINTINSDKTNIELYHQTPEGKINLQLQSNLIQYKERFDKDQNIDNDARFMTGFKLFISSKARNRKLNYEVADQMLSLLATMHKKGDLYSVVLNQCVRSRSPFFNFRSFNYDNLSWRNIRSAHLNRIFHQAKQSCLNLNLPPKAPANKV